MKVRKLRIAVASVVFLAAACSSGSSPHSRSATTTVTHAVASGQPANTTNRSAARSGDAAGAGSTSGSTLAAGPLMPGTTLPVPAGMDCRGRNTVKDAKGDLTCEQTVAHPGAVYRYFLHALPRAGFTVGSDAYLPTAGGGLSASIYFGGAKFTGLDAIVFADRDVTIELQVT